MVRKDIIIEPFDEPEGEPWARLPPPPRSVPPAARWRLWVKSRPPFMFGLIWLVGSLLISIPMSMLADPLGDWRLARGSRTTLGRIEQVVGANLGINDRPVFRIEYTFRLPGGSSWHNASYAQNGRGLPDGMPRIEGSSRHDASQAQRKWPKGRQVLIEYWPPNPNISRIKGMRSGALPTPWLLLVALFPMFGLALVAGCVWSYRRRLALLTHGLPALATIEAARFTDYSETGSGPYQPLAELQPRLETRLGVAQRPTLGTGGCLWIGAGVVVMILALTVCGALFGLSLSGEMPMTLAGRPVSKGMAALFIASCAIATVALCVFMIVQGGRWHAAAVADDQRPAIPPTWFPLDCRFHFQTADGQTVQADDSAIFPVEPGHRFEAQQWVLYDPRRPTRAMLAAGVGDWPFSSASGALPPDPETA